MVPLQEERLATRRNEGNRGGMDMARQGKEAELEDTLTLTPRPRPTLQEMVVTATSGDTRKPPAVG